MASHHLTRAFPPCRAPTCGGQYHWVSEFAPRRFQKHLSFLTGWLVVLAWQSSMVGASYGAAMQIEAIIALANPDYLIKGWHGALLTMAVASFGIFLNVYLIRKLPFLEGIGMVLHVLGFFAFVVVLWVMGPRDSNAEQIFTSFQDNNGWGSIGLATLVGILSPINSLICGDSVCHLSEELQDASRILPLGMIATASVNYVLGFVMTVTLMFTVGSVDDAISSPIGQPYVQVVLNATNSRGATIVLTVVMAILLTFSAANVVTTSSRQIFAFARDKGLPFSDFLSTVRYCATLFLETGLRCC
jgi:choline transport protein